MQQYKRWGALCPANTNEATLYTVPEDKTLIVSHLSVCNISGSASTFSIGISNDGTAGNEGWLYFENPIAADTTVRACLGVTVQEDLIISVKSGNADAVTYQLFGSLLDQP